MSLIDRWIVHCADPLGSNADPPPYLPTHFANKLVQQAEAHRVLGAVIRNFPGFKGEGAFAQSYALAAKRDRTNVAFSFLLTQEASAIARGMRGLKAAVVKGPIFAQRLYQPPALRPFSDIDVLVDSSDRSPLEELLRRLGYSLAESKEYEFKWVHGLNEHIMVEVQTDLIHAVRLRRGITLPHQAIAEYAESPAALLIIALVHGAGHQYERLQHVVDICQAARGLKSADEAEFERTLGATKSRAASITGLLLAARMFGESRCALIAREIGSRRLNSLASHFLGRSAIMSTTDGRRPIYSWRRRALRLILSQAGAG